MFARFSVCQLHELVPTAAQLAFTYRYLGAQLLAHQQYADAQEVFAAAHGYNRAQGDDPAGRLMLEGYRGLSKLLAGDAGVRRVRVSHRGYRPASTARRGCPDLCRATHYRPRRLCVTGIALNWRSGAGLHHECPQVCGIANRIKRRLPLTPALSPRRGSLFRLPARVMRRIPGKGKPLQQRIQSCTMTPHATRPPAPASSPYVSGFSWMMNAEPSSSNSEWARPTVSVTSLVKTSTRTVPSAAA